MKPVFDENGLAEHAGDVRCFYYDTATREYTGWSDEFINIGVSMPGNSTDIDPGDEVTDEVAVFRNGVWVREADRRGEVVYSTADGNSSTVDYIGDIKSGFTTIAPVTPHDKWDGAKWVMDADAQHKAAIKRVENERQQLLIQADAVMLDWRTELMLGEISDENRAKLSEWQAYKNEIKTLDIASDPYNVNWRTPPGV